MANFLKNLTQSLTEGVAEASTKSAADVQRQSELSKLQTQIKEIDIKLEKQYTLLGQLVADQLRKSEPINQDSVAKSFQPIQGLDTEKEVILEKIKEVKAKQAEQQKAEDLLRIKKEVESEIKKLDELKSLGVIDEDEYEVNQVKLNKRVNNFEKLYNLKVAFERGLINQEEYRTRKASLE
jgi:hypothetical protein